MEAVSFTLSLNDAEAQTLTTLENVLTHYSRWRSQRLRLILQLHSNFALAEPDIEQAGDWLQQALLLADALHQTAAQLQREAEEALDQYYTWLYD